MRDAFRWLWWALVVVGVGIVIGAVALVGGDDDEGETVSASEWADAVCGAVAVRRGTIEEIVTDLRLAGTPLAGDDQQEELRGSVLLALERTVEATQTMVEGIALAGVPETSQGDSAAQEVATWAEEAEAELDAAQQRFEDGVEGIGDRLGAIATAAAAVAGTVAGGVQTISDVAELDPELASALEGSGQCTYVRAGRS